MKLIAIIPARGSSKRLPGKNLATVGGKTLIRRAAECAFEAAIFDRVVCATDDGAIHWEAEDAGAQIHLRSNESATDESPTIDVVREVIRARKETLGETFDLIVLLQPTSPLRIPDDIHGTLAVLGQSDAAVSVTEIPKDGMNLMFPTGEHMGHLMPVPGKLVKPNGAVFVLRASALMLGRDWWTLAPNAYVMPPERSVDIDTIADLERARELAGDFYERNRTQEIA